MNLKGRSFLTLLDFTPEEITGLIDLAADLKAQKKSSIPHDTLHGKSIALIFEKTSTRTRCSFEVAARPARRSAKRSPSRTPRASSAGSMTVSSTAASAKVSSRSWQSTPAFPSGTA